jgi:hypothetical protein
VKLITIEGDVFRVDAIEAVTVYTHSEIESSLYVHLTHGKLHSKRFESRADARAAQLRAVTDWKKALE